MSEHVIRLPDVGEGVAEAELVEWHVKVGDLVREDSLLGAVMTDKATVEIPSPVEGEVVWLGAEVGDVVAVGSEIVRLKVAGEDSAAADIERSSPVVAAVEAQALPQPVVKAPASKVEAPAPDGPPRPVSRDRVAKPTSPLSRGAPRPEGERPLASPAVRLRAREAGVDLRQVPGTGPGGRITHDDLDAFFARGPSDSRTPALQARTEVEDIKIVGLRRRIAEKMSVAHARIPHITYVEEIDVTAVEELRATLNRQKRQEQPKLTLLPVLARNLAQLHELDGAVRIREHFHHLE